MVIIVTLELILASNGTGIKLEKTSGEKMIHAVTDGAVELYYDSALKFATTTSGVSITGGITDVKSSVGTAGQVLSSTGTALDWIDAAAGAANVTDTATGINVTSPGTQNIYVGFNAGAAGSANNENTYFGYKAGEGATGSDNVFIGNEAGHLTQNTMSCQVAIGHEAGEEGGEKSVNIGCGVHGGGKENSVALGFQAEASPFGVRIGSLAGQQGSGTEVGTVLIGYRAGYTGSQNGNIAIGYEASNRGNSDEFSTVIGYYANRNLEQPFGGDVFTTAVGYQAGLGVQGSTDGNNGSYFGHRAGYAILSGTQNTLLGSFAGDALTTGSNNIVIGYNAAASSVSVSNEITLGNASITAIRAAVTSITSLSDERDKKDIKNITYGLDFLNKLQPREFVWDNRSEYKEFLPHSKKKESAELKEIVSSNKGKKDFGFIAQEVQAHDDDTLRLIYEENPDKLEMSYGKLVPILVKAIQELSDEVTLLKNK